MRVWFLEIAFAHVSVRVCVCMCVYVGVCVSVSASRAFITIGVIWCEIDPVRLVKFVLQLFSFLLSIKWMDVPLVKQHVMHASKEDDIDPILAIEVKHKLPSNSNKTEHFYYIKTKWCLSIRLSVCLSVTQLTQSS